VSAYNLTDISTGTPIFSPEKRNPHIRFLGVFSSVLPDFRSKPLKVFSSGAICHRSAAFCVTTYPINAYTFVAGMFQT
jgi:hypothetical protein